MDKDHIAKLIEEGSTKNSVIDFQNLAKGDMDASGYGRTLHRACAATLSEFMRGAGIDVPITLGAGALATRIKGRGWDRIAVGKQQSGDVAVAENDVHIFLVVKADGQDSMVIADNQYPGPHKRNARGNRELHHSPVAYFLRAEGAVASALPKPKVQEMDEKVNRSLFPQSDEDTGDLVEPFDDQGKPTK